jgi:ABC-type lipoprotein release transport system permease subunit
MNKLFGIPMTNIMYVMVGLFAISLAGILAVFISNRTMFRMGLRNIPRRRAQSTLVVLGLMLSTLIITAAFTTGDTIDYSITKATYDLLKRIDLELDLKGEGGGDANSQIYVSDSIIPTLEREFANDPDIAGFLPGLRERVPAINPRTRLSEPSVNLAGIDPIRLGRLSGLTMADGGKADLGALTENHVLVSEKLADKLNAKQGDVLTVYARDVAWQLEVVGIVKNEVASGAGDVGNPNDVGGMAASLATVQRITGHVGEINTAFVALQGDVRSSVTHSNAAAEKLDAFFKSADGKRLLGLGELNVKVEKVKKDSLKVAETIGNVFTSFFLVLGLFSIAAGVLLIFMIFVMLAAERKVEMGMARAIGAKRVNLVQSFSAEGMAYNVLAGAVGAALGVGAAFLLVVVGARLVASELSFFTAHVTARSLIISYCLGVVLTFITVVISAFRVSLLNIAAAVRDEDSGVIRTRERIGPKRKLWAALGMLLLLVPPLWPLAFWMILRLGYRVPGKTNWLWMAVSVVGGMVPVLGFWLIVRKALGVTGRTSWLWMVIGLLLLVIPPLGLWVTLTQGLGVEEGPLTLAFGPLMVLSVLPWVLYVLRAGFGLPWSWILGPVGLVLGLLLIMLGKSSEKVFFFALGISLLPLCAAALARFYRAPSRLTWSIVGVLLSLYWLMPQSLHTRLFGKMDGDIEMFVLSGIMIVTGFTMVIVFNARVLTTIFEGMGDSAYRMPLLLLGLTVAAVVVGAAIGNAGGGLGQLVYLLAALLGMLASLSFAAARFPRLAPAMKMGIAYPLSSRFRTGMTIAMFSLIVFSITTFSVINANFAALFSTAEARGGWDIQAISNRNNPVEDLRAELKREGSIDGGQITDIGRTTPFQGAQEVRQVVVRADGTVREKEWKTYPVRAGDDNFWAKNEAKIDIRAHGYGTDRDIYEKVRTQQGFAVMDALPTQSGNFNGGEFDWHLEGVKNSEKEFDPFQIEFRDPVTGKSSKLTVIGVFSTKIPQNIIIGIYTNEATYSEVFGKPDYRVHYLRTTPGVDTDATAKAIKAALVTKGVQTRSIQKEIDEQQAQGQGFTRIFQAFMGLGLFVGIAALGVIAFRSVVERRQQIGMLRAIGYQRGTVSLTFLLESSFVAMMGILSGVVGAAVLARNLFNSDSFTGTSRTAVQFFIPWGEVIVFVVVAYAFSLLMTWWPSRGAARVPVAEALRYE